MTGIAKATFALLSSSLRDFTSSMSSACRRRNSSASFLVSSSFDRGGSVLPDLDGGAWATDWPSPRVNIPAPPAVIPATSVIAAIVPSLVMSMVLKTRSVRAAAPAETAPVTA